MSGEWLSEPVINRKSSISGPDYLQLLEKLRGNLKSVPRGGAHKFLQWALKEAQVIPDADALLFVRLEQFSPVLLAENIKPCAWTEKLVTAIKQQIKESGHKSFDNLSHGLQFQLQVRGSIVVPVKVSGSTIGAVAVFSRHARAINAADRLFVYSLAQIFEEVLAGGQLPSDIPTVIKAKKQWENAVDSLGHIVCLLDESGRIERVNRLLESWKLGTVQYAIGQTIHQLFDNKCTDHNCEFAEEIRKGWNQMLAEGESTWDKEDQQTEPALRFSLRRTGVLDSPESITVDAFAVLTVRKFSGDASGIFSIMNVNSKSELLAVKEDERRHISMELHDGIGQSLAVVKISLENLQQQMQDTLDQQSVEQMEKIIHHIRGSMEDVHRLSTDLSPRYLDSRSLEDALSILCDDLQQVYKEITIKYDIDSISADLTGLLKLTVFRTIQEALGNALKHSHASTIIVSLRQSDDRIVAKITDNGTGFDVAEALQKATGQGLPGIQERVKASKGSVVITSTSKGTSILLTWPDNS